ncbi:hypothetical protein MRX96_003502 [Rhipicephalus microplus]
MSKVLKRLQDASLRLKLAGLRLMLAKCKFMKDRIEYLGHVITAEGLHPSPGNVEAILSAPRPQNVKTLQTFTGSINFYLKLIPHLSAVQLCLHIPRVNVMALQCSVVEELIAFSALDNLKDLACVSVLALCLDQVQLQMLQSQQAQRCLQVLPEEQSPPLGRRPEKPLLLETSLPGHHQGVATITLGGRSRSAATPAQLQLLLAQGGHRHLHNTPSQQGKLGARLHHGLSNTFLFCASSAVAPPLHSPEDLAMVSMVMGPPERAVAVVLVVACCSLVRRIRAVLLRCSCEVVDDIAPRFGTHATNSKAT